MEVVWRKSTRSGGNGGACVEVADLPDGGIAMRDSKDRSGPVLRFDPAQWRASIQAISRGEIG